MPELILTTLLAALVVACVVVAPRVIRAYRAERELVRRRKEWQTTDQYSCWECGKRFALGDMEINGLCNRCFWIVPEARQQSRGAPCA